MIFEEIRTSREVTWWTSVKLRQNISTSTSWKGFYVKKK